MKNSKIFEAITNAIEEYEDNINHKINILESKILGYDKEREYVIKCLKTNNINQLKLYFNI